MTQLPARGEVWWCELSDVGRRPVVVLSRDVAVPRLRRAVIAPCTTNIRGLPSDVVLEPGHDPVPRPSAINLTQSRASRSACLSSVWAGLATCGCARSAPRLRWLWAVSGRRDLWVPRTPSARLRRLSGTRG